MDENYEDVLKRYSEFLMKLANGQKAVIRFLGKHGMQDTPITEGTNINIQDFQKGKYILIDQQLSNLKSEYFSPKMGFRLKNELIIDNDDRKKLSYFYGRTIILPTEISLKSVCFVLVDPETQLLIHIEVTFDKLIRYFDYTYNNVAWFSCSRLAPKKED